MDEMVREFDNMEKAWKEIGRLLSLLDEKEKEIEELKKHIR